MGDLWNLSFLSTPPPITQKLRAKTMGIGGEGKAAQLNLPELLGPGPRVPFPEASGYSTLALMSYERKHGH